MKIIFDLFKNFEKTIQIYHKKTKILLTYDFKNLKVDMTAYELSEIIKFDNKEALLKDFNENIKNRNFEVLGFGKIFELLKEFEKTDNFQKGGSDFEYHSIDELKSITETTGSAVAEAAASSDGTSYSSDELLNLETHLICAICAKITYIPLQPYYLIDSDGSIKRNPNKYSGFLNINNSHQIKDDSTKKIYTNNSYNFAYLGTIPIFSEPTEPKFVNVGKEKRFYLRRFKLPMSGESYFSDKRNLILLFQWDHEPDSEVINLKFTETFKSSITSLLDIESTETLSDATMREDPSSTILNLGEVRYNLFYEMNLKKFILTIRGTDFNNPVNWGINFQIGMNVIREFYKKNKDSKSDEELQKILGNCRIYLLNIIISSLDDLLLVYHLINDNYKLLKHFILTHQNYVNNLLNYLISEETVEEEKLKQLFNKITDILKFTWIKKDILNEKINQFIDILIKYINNSYLETTKDFTKKIIEEVNKIILYLGKDQKDLIICGHSLGGGLTQYATSLFNNKGITFNPVGFKPSLFGLKMNDESTSVTFSLNTSVFNLILNFFGIVNKEISLKFNELSVELITTDRTFYNNIDNLVVYQDLVHRLRLSFNLKEIHQGKLYLLSLKKYHKEFFESYPISTEGYGFSNITVFHGIDGILLLLLKINPALIEKNKEINSELIKIDFNTLSDDIKEKYHELIPELIASIKYLKKYLKYKNKYLKYKNQ